MKLYKKSTLILVILVLSLGATLTIASKINSAPEKPNVLFIVLDTTRSDHVGCYGYNKISTPNIDRLAQEGVLFKNAMSHVPLTFPSHCNMFTSTYPQFSRARDNGNCKLADSAVTLAEVLKQKGYTTAAFVSTMVLDSKYNLDQGFDVYDDEMTRKKQRKVISLMDDERPADEITRVATKWLKENKDKKFFLWAHYYDPHTIYNPPSPYKETYRRNLYDGEIAFADEQIGILLNTLKELGLDKKTLVVFLSDHGESLGEHGESGHAVFIYDATLRVPMIFSYPGVLPEGKSVGGQVRLLDVMPTILDILKIPKNKEMQGNSLYLYIKSPVPCPYLPAYSESMYAKIHFNWSDLQSLRTEEYKYLKSSEPELYDIKADPNELTNIIEEQPKIAQKLDKQLEVLIAKTESKDKDKKDTNIEIDEETRQKLMSLGYIQGTISTEGNRPVPMKMIQVMEKINIAGRLANEGMIDEAIKSFQEVLAVDPNNMDANLRLGQCYKETGNYDEAIKLFKRVAYEKPEEPEAHDGMGNIYKGMGKVKEALEEFEIALKLDPDNPGIINNIGWCYQQWLQVDKAMEYYQKALAIDNKLATTHANMAILYRIKGQLDKSFEELKIALEQEPELAFANSEMCACIATKGDIDGAIPYCEKAIELEPRGVDGYINLGVCLERKGEYQKALENYKKASELAPWNTLVYSNMGAVYVSLKEYDKAEELFKKALQLNPNNRRAQQMLQQINAQKSDPKDKNKK